MTADKLEEKRIYSAHDSRKEFTAGLQAQTQILYDYYMQGRYEVVLNSAQFIYFTIKAILTSEERTKIEQSISQAQETKKNRLPYSVFVENVLQVISDMYDAMHAHKLLLPTFDDSEDEESIESILQGGGL